MASDKEQMLSSANYYTSLVTVAKNNCADAFVQLTTPISEIGYYWKGAAGDQLVQNLSNIKQDVKALYDRLVTLESQMKAQTDSIYNTWPETEDLSHEGAQP